MCPRGWITSRLGPRGDEASKLWDASAERAPIVPLRGLMGWLTLAEAVIAGFVISAITVPAGVSGAVFLLPVQLSVLGVPSPAVTPTNLLFNVVAVPGALARYRRSRALAGPLIRSLLAGTVPGVVVGAVIRVFLVPGPDVFRVVVAALLAPLGVRLCAGPRSPRDPAVEGEDLRPPPWTAPVAAVVGVIGGVYGIGGGSLLGPLLVARRMPVGQVAPAVLLSTFVTSVAGAATFGVLAATARTGVAPEWPIGIACGIGGLIGGYTGARLQPRVPESALRRLLGVLAIALAVAYLAQVGAARTR